MAHIHATTVQVTRDNVPPVPTGKVRLADYGTYDKSLNADITEVARGVGALHGYPTVYLRHVTRGYVIAGACVRWDEARWYVDYTVFDGGRHGRSFLESDEASARAYFAQITDAQTVSRMRQQDAQRADDEQDETAACAKVADTVQIEAAKTYRSAWQWRAEWPGMREWCGYSKTKAGALADGRKALMHRIYCDRADKRE